MARRFSQHFTRFEMDENSNPATIIPPNVSFAISPEKKTFKKCTS